MHSSAVGVLFLLVGSCLGQSGDSPDTQDDEDPEQEAGSPVDYKCFSNIRMYNLTLACNVSERLRPCGRTGSVYFRICSNTKCEEKKENENVTIDGGIYVRNVCIICGKYKSCKNYDVFKIGIPDPPSLSIHFDNETEQYVLDIKAPYVGNEYLKNQLIHQAAIRKEGADWPVCENDTKMCPKSDSISLLKRNLEYSTKYEARVRSKPDGRFYDGSWSQWSETSYIYTEPNDTFEKNNAGQEELGDFLIVMFCCSAALFIFIIAIVLIKLFWKERIKPFIWPELPDHKNALEKLCISPTKYLQISFNPDFFDNYHINKVDYMKAQARTEDNLQITTTDTQLPKHLGPNSCNGTSSAAAVSKEAPALMIHTGQCRETRDHMATNGTHEILSLERPMNPENILLPSSDHSSKCAIPNESPVNPGAGMENFPAYSCAVKQPNSDLRGICWEDISMYIAMSAFKTPNSGIKQPLNV
ncbi:interleukin-7 receptor subunit alpha [Mantella aurantiaca]